MLVLVAIERYRKLCTPFGRQIVGREIYVACAIVFAIAFIVAIPSVSVYGISIKDIPEYPLVKGEDCRAVKSLKHGFIYMAFILILSTSMFVACAVMYSIIGRVLYLHYSSRKNQGKCSSVCSDSTDSSSPTKQTIANINDTSQESDPGSSESLGGSKKKTMEPKYSNVDSITHSSIKSTGNDVGKTLSPLSDPKAKVDNTMRITLMLLVATSMSYLGYIPAIMTEIVKAANAYTLSKDIYKAMNILTRSFYLNNAVNPIVFFLMDKRLRKDARKMYKKIWRKMKSC
ncbi:hypothetical protein FSP39_009608 [Pinctada imbricata]|uniref:G-protein coupled receptors family 1 profile domain-containing protein n=1 Tax=Pinctada imbricata TaxID=66713 RepID=A0AA88XN07_PINIB|nr:hypothetical protein FSP39_009608 [Pinctada imbricata]